MLKALKLPESFGRSSTGFWLCLAFLFLVVLALHGKTVPFNNEYLYLLRLEPNFLPNDWSFSRAANEHWLFNSIFSVPASVFSIESVGWMGRITCWILCLAALVKLGRRWEIPFWAIAVSIGSWLAFVQAVVNAEWIFGTFEAKTVAYVCLLFALYGFSGHRINLPAVLLGLSFSFHPAVGLWAIPAVGLALLFVRVSTPDFIKGAGLTFVFSLPGLLPLLFERSGAETTSIHDWEFIITKHMPHHFDPFYFSAIGMILLGVMLVFNLVGLWKAKSFGLRFICNFQISIALFFLLGVALRWFEFYPLLGFMPMRLFPVLTPLFFLFTLFYFIPRLGSRSQRLAVVVGASAILLLLDPYYKGIGQMRETKESWQAKPGELETALVWISENTPKDAVIISSPNNRKVWYLSRRAQIVSYTYPRYDRLSEWRKRVADVTANVHISDRASAPETIETAFDQLSTAQIAELKQRYYANYLLSRTVYPFPVIFETPTYKIYHLP